MLMLLMKLRPLLGRRLTLMGVAILARKWKLSEWKQAKWKLAPAAERKSARP